jgi:NAD(P)-dependent dehydrogenase (short-subunit alcohol dehydrogenase family)
MSNQPLANLLDLSGQVAVITGASRGIGKGIAAVYRQAGARLTLVARKVGPLEEVAAQLRRTHPAYDTLPAAGDAAGATVLACAADVSDEARIRDVVQTTMDTWGRVDILVNNAGVLDPGPIDQIDVPTWRRLIDVNLTGAYICCRAVAPIMKEQKSGRIINIASISAHTGGASGGAHYAASKGGMISMTRTLARDLAPYGVSVNAISPGAVDTQPELFTPEMRQRVARNIPIGRMADPVDVAYVALFLASPMAAYITGSTLDVTGGLLKR